MDELSYLCTTRDLLGVLATLLACHDDKVCADMHYEEDANVGVDGVGTHTICVGTE
jgi:hypothetical protein